LLIGFYALAMAAPAYATGGYSVSPHSQNNIGPLVDSSGSDAVVPIWDLPIGTLINYFLASIFIILGSGILVPFVGRVQDVLSHDKRKMIYNFILTNPGSTIADISSNLSLNIGTVYHHVWVLEMRRKVFFESHGKFVRVYEGRLASHDKKMDRVVYAHVRNDMSKRLLHTILRDPGISNLMLSRAVGLDKSTIYWYVQRFIKDGLVVMEREGRHKKCYVTDASKAILEECINA
jgi:predicted transcriptional regulator